MTGNNVKIGDEMKEKLFEKYEEFIQFEVKDISERVMKLPAMVGYYQSMYFTLKKKYDDYNNKLDMRWQERYMYYRNEFNISLNHTEIKSFIDKDLEYLELRNKVQEVKTILEQVELTLKGLDSMGWQLKTLIDWEKFKQGNY